MEAWLAVVGQYLSGRSIKKNERNCMKAYPVVAFLFLCATAHFAAAQVPGLLNYQGRVAVGGTNFTGTGQFKFALVDAGTNATRQATAAAHRSGQFVFTVDVADGGAGYASAPGVSFSGGGGTGAAAHALVGGGAVTSVVVDAAGSGYTSDPGVSIVAPPVTTTYRTFWSNGTSTVSLPVTKGLYGVLLGDTSVANMAALAPAVFTNSDVRLRVWFDSGSGLQQLVPDQRVAAAAYALAVPASGIAGTLSDGVLSPNVALLSGSPSFAGTVTAAAYAGNGAGLTNVTLGGGAVNNANLSAQTLSNTFWRLAGNAGTIAGTQYIGTSDNQPVEIKVNGVRALRLEPNAVNNPNVLGGGPGNTVEPGTAGVVIGGGDGNTAASNYVVIAGGLGNQAVGMYSTISGGMFNRASGERSVVAGSYNEVTGFAATVSGGYNNGAYGRGSAVAGGSDNRAGGEYSTVLGGLYNSATGAYSFAAGRQARANHAGASVWADSQNADFASTASNQFSIRAAGGLRLNEDTSLFCGDATRQMLNLYGDTYGIGIQPFTLYQRAQAGAGFAWFSGGVHTNIHNDAGPGGAVLMTLDSSGLTVNGACAMGCNTTASGPWSFAAGSNSLASGLGAVAMGFNATATHSYATAMGYYTTASGDISTALGALTTASGNFSTALGRNTMASGDYSTALGYVAFANHLGSFVWSDGSSLSPHPSSTADYSVTMRAAGGYRFFSNAGMTAGASLAANGTSWAVISDRHVKKDFAPVDSVGILEKLAAMPVTQWHYQWEDAAVTPHIGPMAQDFKAAFYPGTDDKSITTLEFDGVALAAIQGLNEKVESGKQQADLRLEQLETENAELKLRLEKLEQRLLGGAGM